MKPLHPGHQIGIGSFDHHAQERVELYNIDEDIRETRDLAETLRNKVMSMWKLLTGCFWALNAAAVVASLSPIVEVEEDVYQYTPADNGAGPADCS